MIAIDDLPAKVEDDALKSAYLGFHTTGLGSVSYGYQGSTLPGTFLRSR